jgi:hypothetical protein
MVGMPGGKCHRRQYQKRLEIGVWQLIKANLMAQVSDIPYKTANKQRIATYKVPFPPEDRFGLDRVMAMFTGQ